LEEDADLNKNRLKLQ